MTITVTTITTITVMTTTVTTGGTEMETAVFVVCALVVLAGGLGVVVSRNPVHSARGLFQLTRVNYHLNPNGEASFGNGVEEAQGGIRYIKQRYGSADKAVAQWHQRGWS